MPETIVIQGAPILAQKTKEVPKDMFGTPELERLIARMSEALRASEHGVAIAANQIALPYRLFVVRGFVMEGKERSAEGADAYPDVPFVNPALVKLSRKKEIMEEACLSVPGYHGTIKRSLLATVKAFDGKGKKVERGASGLLAQIFQHECDHLDGILYIEKAEEVHESKENEIEEA